MRKPQNKAKETEEVSAGTILFIAVMVLIVPLLFAGFLFQ
ncbi:hypothetical protein TUMEXPCC7403_00450 [Tumidithrix helvetica PCC 7403]